MKPTNALKVATLFLASTVLIFGSCNKQKDPDPAGWNLSLDKFHINFDYDSIHLATVQDQQPLAEVAALQFEKTASEALEIINEHKEITTVSYIFVITTTEIYLKDLRLINAQNQLVTVWDTPYAAGVAAPLPTDTLNCEKFFMAESNAELKDEILTTVNNSGLKAGSRAEYKVTHFAGKTTICISQ